MSDSVVILNNEEINEKRKLINNIKDSAMKLQLDLITPTIRHKLFNSESIEEINKYLDLCAEIIDFCDYEKDNFIDITVIELCEMCEKMSKNEK